MQNKKFKYTIFGIKKIKQIILLKKLWITNNNNKDSIKIT